MIVYEGPSMLDHEPIVAIATGLGTKSKNPKTGDMIQVWIIRQDVAPIEAVKTGTDSSVCGGCPHRGSSCYVNVAFAPHQVWKAYKAGKYGRGTLNDIATAMEGRAVRLGAYGDPAALPIILLNALTTKARTFTGYTHQWTHAEGLKPYCMASVDNEAEYARAVAEGWRTFRVRRSHEALVAGEIQCPASEEGGKLVECATCGLCKGTSRKAKNIAIVVHGARAKRF